MFILIIAAVLLVLSPLFALAIEDALEYRLGLGKRNSEPDVPKRAVFTAEEPR